MMLKHQHPPMPVGSGDRDEGRETADARSGTERLNDSSYL